MTLSTLDNRFSFAGDGVSTVFPFNAKFLSATDLKVLLIDDATEEEESPVLDTDFTVSGGNNLAGSVTFNVAPPDGTTVVIYRDPSLTQDLNLDSNDRLPPAEMTRRLDKLTQISQRDKEKYNRAVGFREGFTGTFDPRLPIGIDDIDNAEKVLIINESADGFDFGPTVADIEEVAGSAADAIAAAAAAAASEALAVEAAVQATQSAADAASFLEAAGTVEDIDTTGGNVARTLPLASDGSIYITYINKSFASVFNVVVSPTGPDLIHGQANDTLAAGEVGKYWSNGVDAWYKLN